MAVTIITEFDSNPKHRNYKQKVRKTLDFKGFYGLFFGAGNQNRTDDLVITKEKL